MIIEKLRRSKDYLLVKHSKYFDADWYKKHYNVKGNAVRHYILYGANSGYNPSANFSRIKYELIYEDVRYTGANPIIHYEKYGCYEDVFEKEVYIGEREHEKLEKIKSIQDKLMESLKSFRLSKSGRRYAVNNLSEACNRIPAKVFKEQRLWCKSKEPIWFIQMDPELD